MNRIASLILPVLLATLLPAQPPAPVAHWAGEGNAQDSSSNGNHGVQSGPVSYVPGVVGQAFRFDGGRVQVPSDPALMPTTGQITVAFWFATTALPTRRFSFMVSKATWAHYTPDSYEFGFLQNADVRWEIHSSTSSGGSTGNGSEIPVAGIRDGLFHHFVAAYDGAAVRLFIDGQLIESRPATGPLTPSTIDLALGCGYDNETPDFCFTGVLDEVRIYDVALTPEQVDPPGFWRTFGAGCPGTAGVPTLDTANAGDVPIVGKTFRLRLNGLTFFTSPVGLIGASDQTWQGLALPVALDAIGASGCSISVSVDVWSQLSAVSGAASWNLPIPYDSTLWGQSYFAQGLVLDRFANPLGLVTSNAGELVIGMY